MTSTNMGWNLPVTGASGDVWGDLLNAIINNQDSHSAGMIYGLTLSAAGSTATFGIAAGAASGMVLSSAYTKTTSAWGVGTGQGALDTGAIANSTWYHVYLIQRTDTGVVDVLVSTSATAPTMPTNYTRKRRIGAMLTNGSAQWVKFVQLGDFFLWDVPVQNIANVAVPTSVTSYTLTVPTGVQVVARCITRGLFFAAQDSIRFFSPDCSDASITNVNLTNFVSNTANDSSTVELNIRTNTSGQIKGRSTAADALVVLNTHGWLDPRGQY